jgi:hypothetical protein
MNWKDVLHYGSAALLVLIGVAGMLGVHLPGVTIDPTVCFATAAGIFGAGLKGGWTTNGSKPIGMPSNPLAVIVMALLGAALFASLIPVPASAQTAPIATKSPASKWSIPSINCTPSSCRGFNIGLVLGTNTQNGAVVPTLTSITGGNGLLGGEVGYRFWNGSYYFGAEADMLYQTGQSGSVINFNPQNFMAIVEGDVGVSLAGLFNISAPNPSQGPLASIPAALATSLMTPYVMPVADCINYTGGGSWIQRYCGGVGAEFAIGGPYTIRVKYLNEPAAGGLSAANLILLEGVYNF